jgi:hypothetical protein
MKALFTLRSAINQSSYLIILALVSLSPAVYPEIVLAAELQTQRANTALVFEINSPSKLTANEYQSAENQNTLPVQSIESFDPLTNKLRVYLEEYNSPLAAYAEEIPNYPQWQRALAISWVESNFCIHHANNNCSGIGVAPGHPYWRKYPNHLAWFEDMTQLLEKPIYKERFVTFEKMRGIYVKPGSRAWVVGAKTKYAELMALTAEAENERLAINQNSNLNGSLVTFPELAMLTK